ncbi:MAG: hypothetical protein NC218_02025 [Acetobacter sp.]|nr:hypothetical protein [Acetobacter sp.]
MKTQDRYQIKSTKRGTTSRGGNYFDIEAIDTTSGEIVQCVYFGNTTPKRLLDIVERVTENAIYHLAVIQPHTSRDKKTGRFTTYKRAVV